MHVILSACANYAWSFLCVRLGPARLSVVVVLAAALDVSRVAVLRRVYVSVFVHGTAHPQEFRLSFARHIHTDTTSEHANILPQQHHRRRGTCSRKSNRIQRSGCNMDMEQWRVSDSELKLFNIGIRDHSQNFRLHYFDFQFIKS